MDLNDLTADWECPVGEICARVVGGRDGGELVQMRVDLGVLQMFPDGRPDGSRYHGMPSVREYVQREFSLEHEIHEDDWRELKRELGQVNYRRLAFTALADDAMQNQDLPVAAAHLRRAVRDSELGLCSLRLMRQAGYETDDVGSLRPTLLFNRARLLAQLHVLDERFEEAIEGAEAGAEELEVLLSEFGFDPEQHEHDPGVAYLHELARHLRQEYGIELTLRERLGAAIEREDFEEAARLRDELRRRTESKAVSRRSSEG
ncbi:MAG: UvrB/UvrC motif-containing protein [Planctomycetes bacterium]|nr:UvrB/UvrC motif-containing protein [Planctomycetota bacterium]